MQKTKYIPAIVFEILKSKTPAIWLVKCIFALNYDHVKWHDKFAALTDMMLDVWACLTTTT